MKTICIQIGNSDDKLTQVEWSEFAESTHRLIDGYSDEIHFSGASWNCAPWQNACWVAVINLKNLTPLKNQLKMLRKKYKQDSVAFIEGDTDFI